MNRYEYHRPKTLDEAIRVFAGSPAAKFVAGGTDLFVQMKKRSLPTPPALISLRGIEELRRIDDGESIRIGACAPLDDVARHPTVRDRFPALARSIDLLGSRQIRNVATLGGNLCNASPGADTAPPLMVYRARIEVRGRDGSRDISIEDLFVGPGRTSLRSGEILSAILLDRPSAAARSVFLRKGRVLMDLAIASLAVLLEMRDGICREVRLAVGAVAPVPRRLEQVETSLIGSRLEDGTVARARALAATEIAPITDVRSTEAYRRDLVGVFVKRAIEQLRSPDSGRAGGTP